MHKKSILILGALICLGQAVQAQTTEGTITGTNRQGVYLANRNGVTFIPYSRAKFRVNGRPISDRQIRDGMRVSVYPERRNDRFDYIPREFYDSHRDWDWNRSTSEWQKDRSHWHRNRDRWERD